MSLGIFGCQTDLAETSEGIETGALTAGNGLPGINGLTTTNGLATHNGLATSNGLATHNGLSDTTGLITTPAGRSTIAYMAKCALPSGRSISKVYGSTTYSFPGSLGLAPAWENGACDLTCQERVSACMMALVNTTGVHVPLWMTSPISQIGWGQNPGYPDLEGAFWGNIFMTKDGKVPALYCEGPTQVGLVPGRIGADQPGSPYSTPWGAGGRCGDSGHCKTTGVPMTNGKPDGYSSCNGYPNVITVWRNAAATPVFDPALKYMMKNVKSGKMLDWDDVGSSMAVQQWTPSGNTNQQWMFVPEFQGGTYHIVSVKSLTKCLELPAGSTAAGTMAQVAPCNGGANQSWTVKTSNGIAAGAYGQYFRFMNVASPTNVLEVPGASTVNGTRMDIAAFTPTNSQVWSISVAQ